MRAIAVVLLLAAALPSFAQQNFGAVVSGDNAETGCFILPIPIPVQQWYEPDRVDSEDVRTIASGDGRRVFALMRETPLRIVEIRPDGSQAPFYAGPPAAFGLSLAVAANGTVFATTGGGSPQLVRISPAGVLEATYPLLSDEIAVAADGCTVYYRDDSDIIRRINGCTGAPLPDFAALGTFIRDLEVLATGEVLIALESQIRLYDAAGTFVRVVADLANYGLALFESDAVAARGGVVYLTALDRCDADASVLLRVALADGQELGRAPLQVTHAEAIVIGAGAVTVPTLGEMALAMLAFALAAGGAFVLKLR